MIHPTAEVDDTAIIGQGTRIWHHAQVREGAEIGDDCIIGKGAYIGIGVRVGDRCKIQNYACLYEGTVVGEGVFVGPHTVILNDRYPSAIKPDGTPQQRGDWRISGVSVQDFASIGANATILPGVTVGKESMIGAGAVVTGDTIADYTYVGNPATPKGKR